jgi:hypothetical protein
LSRIYVASSWRNKHQPDVVSFLKEAGHRVYDFRHPGLVAGFRWTDCDPEYEGWTSEMYRYVLTTNPRAAQGYALDRRAMQWADACVLVTPSGPSAHLEAGYFHGASKRLVIYIPEKIDPDLMYLMADDVCLTRDEVLRALEASR